MQFCEIAVKDKDVHAHNKVYFQKIMFEAKEDAIFITDKERSRQLCFKPQAYSTDFVFVEDNNSCLTHERNRRHSLSHVLHVDDVIYS